MRKLFQKKFTSIHGFLSKFPGFSKPEKYSLSFLNTVQFCGALNDNIYKLILIFYLIQLEGVTKANTILSMAGAIFVIPFLLFSSTAGVLADGVSKNRLIIGVKFVGILIILLAIAAFAFKISWGSYAILFLLSTQSAVFGPSKYGIIPELVPKNKVSKANGLITSFTYIAIITGTFLASFLTEITHRNYVLIACFCLFVAITGFLSSFGIKHTPPSGSKRKANPLFLKEILNTLFICKNYNHLLLSILGGTYFLFLGAFVQLNIIPFAINSLNLTEIAGGYLFLVTALGIVFGSWLVGKTSTTHHVELALTVFSSICIFLFFYILSVSSFHLWLAVFSLFSIGFCGGVFIVPFESFIQLNSPEKSRASVIAAYNFLSFIGVLIASFALFLFNEMMGLSAAASFSVMGTMTVIMACILILRLSDHVISFISRKLFPLFISVRPLNLSIVHKSSKPILMLEEGTPFKAMLLSGVIPNLHLLIPQYKIRRFPWFQRIFFSLHRIESPQKFETLVTKSKMFYEKDMIPCIYLTRKRPIPEKQIFSLKNTFTMNSYEIISVNIEKTTKDWQIQFSKFTNYK